MHDEHRVDEYCQSLMHGNHPFDLRWYRRTRTYPLVTRMTPGRVGWGHPCNSVGPGAISVTPRRHLIPRRCPVSVSIIPCEAFIQRRDSRAHLSYHFPVDPISSAMASQNPQHDPKDSSVPDEHHVQRVSPVDSSEDRKGGGGSRGVGVGGED